MFIRKGVVFLFSDYLKNFIKSFFVSLISAVVLLLISGYICYLRDNPAVLFKPLGVVVLYISAFIGGVVVSKMNADLSNQSAVIYGIAYSLIILIFSFLLRDKGDVPRVVDWLMYLAVVLASFLGGVVSNITGGKKKGRAKRPKRKRA